MATPHGLAQDHTTLTFGGAAKAKWTKGKEWLHRKADKVLDNLMYFQAFDTTGAVLISGEMCLKASASWRDTVTMDSIKHMIAYNRTGGRNVDIAFNGSMTTLFNGNTPAALCPTESPGKVTLILSKYKDYRDNALVSVITKNGESTIVPFRFTEAP